MPTDEKPSVPSAEQIENRLFINGNYVQATGGSFPLRDPSDGNHVCEVGSASQADVDRAVKAAEAAQPSWQAQGPAVWSRHMRALAALLRIHGNRMVMLESLVAGKLCSNQDGQVAANAVDYFSSLATSLHGDTTLLNPGQFGMTIHQPYGVVAAIVPWNAPLVLTMNKVAPALLTGNTVVVKTSERSPLSLIYLAQLFHEAGFPPGVLNVVNGGGDVGKYVAEHPTIRKIAFTGSIATGKKVVRSCIDSNLKSVSLELGGKSPCIVFDDADLQTAVAATEFSVAYNCGQVCMSNSRIYVQSGIAPAFIRAFTQLFTSRVPGDPKQAGTTLGPLVDELAHSSVTAFLNSARKEGGTIIDARNAGEGGKARVDVQDVPGQGFYIRPTILMDLDDDARCVREEIFGPVVFIKTFDEEAEVIKWANDTEFGLYASVFTKDLDRALRLSRTLEAGTVAVNQTSPSLVNDMPFSGFKQSGWGSEYGNKALEKYTREKTVIIKMN